MLSLEISALIIIVCCILGLIWAIINALSLNRMKIGLDKNASPQDQTKLRTLFDIAYQIEHGANAFLFSEYKYIAIFCIAMAILIFLTVEEHIPQIWATSAFILGCLTSLLAGYIGMRVATFSNYRCAFAAWHHNMSAAFNVAYRAGCVMGFTLVSLGLLVLTLIIIVYQNNYLEKYSDIPAMYEAVACYGLGASTIALFGRVGGGIFTKAADVGADLVGKIEESMNEDSPNNPATIADNVGDNVGDIAGMGSDLFGSFAEATSAALVISSSSIGFQYQPNAIWYPLFIMAFGIVVCIITSCFAFGSSERMNFAGISNKLKLQLIISTILLTPALWLAAYLTLQKRIYFDSETQGDYMDAFWCTMAGLWGGLIIGFVTEYFTSHAYGPVREVANACTTGAATNVIYGLALGNISTIIPIIVLAVVCFIAHSLLGMYGVALAALGMLSNLAISLAIDAYGPVADNAGGITEMCGLGDNVRRITDDLDAAGNTTAAIGKGFAIGSAGLVSLALYGAFITRASHSTAGSVLHHPISNTNIQFPLIFSGLLIGAMLPYAFSALCLKSVGSAALKMVNEIRRQLSVNPGIKTGQVRPDYGRCIQVATDASLIEMFLPALVVLGVPFLVGFLFGPTALAGVLPGILISGVCMAISQANAGGAWDNAKKYISSGEFRHNGVVRGKGTFEHNAAIIGDTVGDPMKDTSGPSLNILVKLSAIFSLIFYKFFDRTALLQCYIIPRSTGCGYQQQQ